MKLVEFSYKEGKRKVLVMNHDEQHVEGLDLAKMNPEESNRVLSLFTKMDEDLKPYMKFYRKFMKRDMV